MTDAPFSSFREVVDLWVTREALADDLGINSRMVSKWWQRDRIPSEWWRPMLETPRAISNGLTADTLTRLAARDLAEVRA